MINSLKEEKEEILKILQQLNYQDRSKSQLKELMIAVGFEDDVAFAKSLFTQKIVQLYRQNNSEYEVFLSKQALCALSESTRKFLISLFRKFHEYKISKQKSSSKGQEEEKIKFPDINNVEEVINFQKKMYQLFKNLTPNTKKSIQPVSSHNLPNNPKFTPFPIFPERSYRSFGEDCFPPMSPYLPTPNIKYQFQDWKKHSSDYSLGRNESHFERPSLFSKNSFQFEKSNILPVNGFHEEDKQPGFLGMKNDYFSHMNPSKKIKEDQINVNFTPHSLQSMKRQLQLFNRSKGEEVSLFQKVRQQKSNEQYKSNSGKVARKQ